jgi:hypothetical protein
MKIVTAAVIAAGISFSVGTGPAFAQGQNPPGVDPTHYQCYRVSAQKPIRAAAKLKDQFVGWGVRLGRAMLLCNPVEKNGERPKDPDTHLVCYSIPAKNAGKKVVVRHQFGEQVLTVGGTVFLCLPSTKKVL